MAQALRPAVSSSEPDGTTPLHVAVLRNDTEGVDVLLRAGANATATTRYGVAPLYLACVNGNAAVIEKLLAAGADPNTALPEGETALMTAARTGSVPAIKSLLAHGANLNAKEGWKGQTALMWAAADNNADAVKLLIEAGADIKARTKSGAFSAYLFAARAGHIEAAGALLDAGARINETLPDGTSALVLAIINAHYEAAAFLVDRGADPNADAQGWAPLHQVVWSRRPNTGNNLPGAVPTGRIDSLELVRKLLKHGAAINARQKKEPRDGNRNMLNRIGATPFLLAAKSVDVPLMRLFLEHGADPKLTTEDGTTALMAAAGVGIWAPGENPGTDAEALAAVKLAYEAGGGLPTDVDKNGETALHGAMYRGGSIAVAQFLIEKGTKLDVKNNKGWTPLVVADGVEYTPNVLKRYPETAAFLRQVMTERGLPVLSSLESPPGAGGLAAPLPRITPVPESSFTDAHRQIVTTYGQDGTAPNDLLTYLHHPVLARNIMPFERYIATESTLPPRHRELLILRTAVLCRSEYVWAHHAPAARKAGITADELSHIARGPDAGGWQPFEAALLRAADELHVSAFVSDATWAAMSAMYDTRQMIDAVFTVAEFTMVSDTVNSARVQVEDGFKDRLPSMPSRAAMARSDERLIGKTPRIAPLEPSEWTAEVRQWLERSGSGRPVAGVYRTYARHLAMDQPRTLVSEHIRRTSTLPPLTRELLIMRIGVLCRSEYEWAAHAPAGRRTGMTDADVRRIVAGPEESGDPLDGALLRAVDEIYRDDVVSDETWRALGATFDSQQLLDILITTAGYRMVSMALNSLGVQLEPGAERFPTLPTR